MNKILDFVNSRKTQPAQQNTNPFVPRANEYVASHGGDQKTAFMQLCRENGVNMPNVNTPEEAFEVLKKQINVPNVVRSLFGGGR